MERLIYVLLFSGLFICITCEYILIQLQETWDEAQLYCRQNHFDLVTVQSIEDWTNIQRAIPPGLIPVVWTGLYNDISSWRWSHHDEPLSFLGWNYDQPDNRNGEQECVSFEFDGWSDADCTKQFHVFCFNDVRTGADRFIFVSNVLMSWSEAQSYCRQHHTDLATIRTQADNDLLQTMVQVSDRVWIGLFRDSWKWSDGTNFSMSSINWMSTTRDIIEQNRPCGAVGPDGRIDDRNCLDALPFICKQTESIKQIVRLEMKSGQNVNDPAVMETILQGVKQKLKDRGIEKNTILTWRWQPDGNVFSPKQDREAKQEHCSEF